MRTAGRRAQFFQFFRRRVACIVEMQPPVDFAGQVNFDSFKLLLVCAHLEALAKARFAPRDSYGEGMPGSGVRFCRLLERHSGLTGVYVLVALPRAQRLFERRREEARAKALSCVGHKAERAANDANIADRATGVLGELVRRRGHDEACGMSRVEDGADLDLPVSAVADALRSAGIDPDYRLIAEVLRDERYSGIVWREVRCGLFHEARVIRQGFDLGEDRDPYYFSEEPIETGLRTYPLVIPARFLLRTLRNCVDHFEAFCSESDIDPYSCFDVP